MNNEEQQAGKVALADALDEILRAGYEVCMWTHARILYMEVRDRESRARILRSLGEHELRAYVRTPQHLVARRLESMKFLMDSTLADREEGREP